MLVSGWNLVEILTWLLACGVPQGSIMGPFMFIIYINDLPQIIENCQVAMYADDTILYCAGTCVEEVRYKLQQDLDNIMNWLCGNRLSLNVGKTKSFVFSTRHYRESTELELNVRGEVLEQVDSYKYLGVFLDQNLGFVEHVDYMVNGKVARNWVC